MHSKAGTAAVGGEGRGGSSPGVAGGVAVFRLGDQEINKFK